MTMAVALVSELTGRTVRNDLATTGEITLSGNVLAVCGHQGEGAGRPPRRAGAGGPPKQKGSRVEDDLGDDLRHEIGVQYVSTIDEALDLALSSPAGRQKNG